MVGADRPGAELGFSFAASTASFLIFAVVTALALIWVAPIFLVCLFCLAAAATPPPSSRKTATVDITLA